MARNLVNRYVWLVDTISRYGRITLKDLNKAWLRSEISEGKPLARRTFFHYRDGVEEMFDINIQCDKSTFEYYIDDSGGENNARLQSWLVDSASMSGMLSNARDISERIMVENVPSAREHLPVIIDALKQNRRIRFSYKSYTRSRPTDGIVLEPYFVKIFKQLWYVIGLNVKDGLIKTYSLDRIGDLNILQESFTMPANVNPSDFSRTVSVSSPTRTAPSASSCVLNPPRLSISVPCRCTVHSRRKSMMIFRFSPIECALPMTLKRKSCRTAPVSRCWSPRN